MELKILFISLLIGFVNSQLNTTLTNEEVNELLKNVSALIPNSVQTFVQSAQFETLLKQISDNVTCYQHLKHAIKDLRKPEIWATEMIDAWAKPQTGLQLGNIMHMGNWEECIRINHETEDGLIEGKYCAAVVDPHPTYGAILQEFMDSFFSENDKLTEEDHIVSKLKRSYSICVPASCTADDLQLLANLTEELFKSPAHFSFEELLCTVKENSKLDTAAIITLCIFGFFGVLLVASTIYDIFVYQKSPKTANPLFIIYSMYTNGAKIFATKKEESSLGCLNGIRVITMMWIVLCHRLMFEFFVPEANAMHFFTWVTDRKNMFLRTAAFGVDTFFLISGLLVTYIFMNQYNRGVKISIPFFYIHRLLRLSPSLIMVTLFCATLIKYTGDGPFWIVVDLLYQKACEENWWQVVFYLQNYIKTSNQCMGQGWYLAADTQMYFISPLILFSLIKWPKRTIGAIVGVMIAIAGYVIYITYAYKFVAHFIDANPDNFIMLYAPTHIRGSVYLLGMIYGYVIYKKKKNPFKIPKIAALALWVISLGVILYIQILVDTLEMEEYNVWKHAIFNATSRVAWSLAVGTIILLCVNGYGSFINKFLSCSIFQILIRLNYNVYLVHPLILAILNGQNRWPIYYTNLATYHHFWGDYAYSLAVSVVFTLAFESPIIALEKILLRRSLPKSKKNGTSQLENGENGINNAGFVQDTTLPITSNEINMETVDKRL